MRNARTHLRRPAALAALLLAAAAAAAPLAALDVPPLTGRVVDRANLLSPAVRSDLESYLAAVEKSSGAQIALLTVPSLEGEDLEAFSIRVADAWKLGSAEKDDGALLLVALAEKAIRIEVGYGLEGELTDAKSGYIIREVIVPAFKSGDFEAGIVGGLKAIAGVATGDADISPDQIDRSGQEDDGSAGIPVMIILFIVFSIIMRMARYRRYRRGGLSPGTALFMGAMLSGRRGGFGGGGFSGGGGGFSGGGGGFGGGGASGGW